MMRFPETPRVIYKNNVLHEVICQLRYPTILKIEAESPAGFQERIRSAYPVYEEQVPQSIAAGLPPEIAKLVEDQLGGGVRGAERSYNFKTEDGLWTVGLRRDFFALSTTDYKTWGDFRAHLAEPFEALKSAYPPSFISRVGLRYRDVIARRKLGLEGVPWAELLQPFIAGELADELLADGVSEMLSQVRIQLPDNLGSVLLRHGLANIEGYDEVCFLIDMDFSTADRTEVAHAIERLDAFNRLSGSLFRHCISERLHTAMGPERPH